MKLIVYVFCICLLFFGCSEKKSKLNGPYLGQPLPGNEAVLFAPGIVNTGMPTRDITFTPDGKEFIFSVNIGNSSYATIFFCKETENGWSNPEVLHFARNPEYIYIEPFISPDGSKLFFVSNKGNITPGNRFLTDIWISEREESSWGEPYKLDTLINSKYPEYFPSVSENGNLYFTREEGSEFIFMSEFIDGHYQKPVKLPDHVNGGMARYNATISRDESFIIVPVYGLPDSRGTTDYYISFNDPEKGWSNLINLGDKINSPSRLEYSANFSPDGKYFFFITSKTFFEKKEDLSMDALKEMHNLPENGNSNIYWIDASFIDDLKSEITFPEN